MSHGKCILCDRRGRWASAIARALPEGIALRQVAGLEQCTDELTRSPESFLALAVDRANLPAVLRWLDRLTIAGSRSRALCLADQDVESYEWVLREAGAVHVASSLAGLGGLAAVVESHFAQVPRPRLRPAERLWQLLPWSDR